MNEKLSYSYVWYLLSIFLLLTSQSFSAPGEIREDVGNGCFITRQKPNTTSTRRILWWDMPLPNLNCTGSGKNRLELDGVIEDIVSISLSYNNLIELYVDDLKKFTLLRKLEVKSNQLQRIVPSKSNFVLKKTLYISFSNNELPEVPTEALKHFPNLTTLVLSNNKISVVKDDDFKYNRKLNHLMLGINPIESFNDAWMKGLPLQSLNLRDCGLTMLPTEIANVKSLIFADFSDNKLTTVPANSFANCGILIWLELASNSITFIDENAFNGTIKLTSLDLSDNLLETISSNTFDSLSKENLEINLYENPLNCNCSLRGFKMWIDQMERNDASTEVRYTCKNPMRNHGKKSRQLNINDYSCEANDVTWQNCELPPTIPSTTLSTTRTTQPTSTTEKSRTCPKYCTCYDENRKIYYPSPRQPPNKKYEGRLYWRTFGYPRVDCVETSYNHIPQGIPDDVKTLVMYGNKMPQLHLTLLKRFKKLEAVFLKKNSIKTIVSDRTINLPNLSFLHLAHNDIVSINKKHLQGFPNLQVIALYNNKLNSISQDLFGWNRKLNRLYLGPNPVRSFKEDFMKTLNLRSLSLRNMSLSSVPKSISKLVNLTYVDLSDNMITSIPNGTFSRCKSLVRVALDNNKISKIGANAFNGAGSLFYVDLSENLLTNIPGTLFANISKERLTVELWDNKFICDCKMRIFKAWIKKTEDDDPMTEIRFLCDQPARMHQKKSDQLTANDFVCQKGDKTDSTPDETSICPPTKTCGGSIALSVVLTFIFTLLLGVIMWRFTFKRRYGDLLSYAKQRNRFDDMEELQ